VNPSSQCTTEMSLIVTYLYVLMSTLDDFILKIHTYKPATEYLKVYSNKVSLLSSKNSDSVSTGDRRFAVAGPRLLEEFTDFLASF